MPGPWRVSYFKERNFRGRNFRVFANFWQNRESLIPQKKNSKAVFAKMPKVVIRESLFLKKIINAK